MKTAQAEQSQATEPPPVEYLARIKPTSKRQTHVIRGRTFRKSKGWHGPITDREFVEELCREPENELNPKASDTVFEVRPRAEVIALAEAEERAREEETEGTARRPRKPPAPVTPISQERSRR
jgi:hypothetical protein